ncbi:carbohydrate-binding family V/XII [Mangrovimonas sp. CR14]|uniref:carbohydrate-binding family V/XII n=1 Tax=Mangrovimonas sp. CR14 TaxID=2706120 RepID=UPI0014226E6D|nr:carbohydrate-binding family V/XII [Mangrovimonas sp. CR14]NIK93247.1 carbohydrate-binding family V/XII [Mangrovimonas sp. CR14]
MKSHHFQYFIIYYKHFITKTSYWFVFLLLGSLQLVAQETGTPWPKEIESGSYIITLYHPENISYIDLRLDANTAFSVKKGEEGTPTFGMMWTTSLLDVDRNTRIASLVSVKVNEVRFPEEVSEESKNSFKKLIEEEVPKWDVQFSLDDLIESIENVSAYDADLNTSPPKILFSSVPSVLISIDGEPKFKAAEKETEVILNSSAFIAHDTQSGLYYLKGGDFWYEAKAALGPWNTIKKAPSKIRKLAKKAESDTDDEEEEDYQGVPPKIIVTTEPSELIVTDGEPSYAPLQNTSLLYVENSQDDLFMNINQQSYYILLSGRWFTSKSVEGPWNFVEADALPEDFKKIGSESKKGHVLPSVAGTKEAKEALYDNQIPQTAAVDRTTQASKVNYDGEPAFEKIEGLQLEYAVNTQSDVFKDKNTYYLCDNAIWFESSSPNGPWKVSNDRPSEVSQIPPENPKYNTKYVYIYETTPSVVYVGYTPGYYGSYVYHNTIFYGTGYYYNPWYNGFYYRYPFTYGFSVRYNPWYGWSFGFHFGSPFAWWGYGYWGRWNYWGPPFYRPPYYRPGYRPRPSRPIYHGGRRGVNRYARPVTRPNVRPNRPSTRPTTRPNTRPTTRPNTRPTTPSTRPTTRPTTRPNMPSTRPSTRPSVPTTRPQTRPSRPMTRPAPRPSRPVARPAGGRVRR